MTGGGGLIGENPFFYIVDRQLSRGPRTPPFVLRNLFLSFHFSTFFGLLADRSGPSQLIVLLFPVLQCGLIGPPRSSFYYVLSSASTGVDPHCNHLSLILRAFNITSIRFNGRFSIVSILVGFHKRYHLLKENRTIEHAHMKGERIKAGFWWSSPLPRIFAGPPWPCPLAASSVVSHSDSSG